MIGRKEAAAELLRRREARRQLAAYIGYTSPKYKQSGFSAAVCAALDLFIDDMQAGRRPILVLQAPPQHGKSEIVSRKLPAYILGRFPDWRVGAASYSDELANAMAQDVRRNLADDRHKKLFPQPAEKRRYDVNRTGEFTAPSGAGGYLGVGVGAGLTGRPVDCLVAGTLVDTDCGKIPIEKLQMVGASCKVLAYRNGELSYERIKAFASGSGFGIWRITTARGRVLETTGNHRVYTTRGYVRTLELATGDVLLSAVREPIEQLVVEFGDPVRSVSQRCSPPDGWEIEEDRVVGVDRVCEEAVVFDIQVETACNFFANGVLVHNCGIIDDPVKNEKEALSPTTKEGHWNWYQSVFTTRLSENSGQIIMATSWAEDDLPARICNHFKGDPRLTVLRFPAINEPGEVGYNPNLPKGPLVPELKSLAFLQEVKGLFSDYWWAAMYQQCPRPLGGNVFKEEGLRYYLPKDLPAKFDKVVGSLDATFKDTDGTDFVVIQVWGKTGANSYLLAQSRARMSFTKTVAEVVKTKSNHPRIRQFYIEDKANGPAVIDTLKGVMSGLVPIEPDGSKLARAHAVTHVWEAGNVWLPHPDLFPWVKDLVGELTAFPAAANDDQVDAMTQALRQLYPLFNKLKISQAALDKAMGRG